jgi:hypothetical protein
MAIFLFSFSNIIMSENYYTCSGHGFKFALFRVCNYSDVGHFSLCIWDVVRVDAVRAFISVCVPSSHVQLMACTRCLTQELTVYSICSSQNKTVATSPTRPFLRASGEQLIVCSNLTSSFSHLKEKYTLIRYVILLPLPCQLVSLRFILMADG